MEDQKLYIFEMVRKEYIRFILFSLIVFIVVFLFMLFIFPCEYKEILLLVMLFCFTPSYIYGVNISSKQEKFWNIPKNGLIFIFLWITLWIAISFSTAYYTEELIIGFSTAIFGYFVGIFSHLTKKTNNQK